MGREVVGEEEGATRTTERAEGRGRIRGRQEQGERGDKNNERGSDTGRGCHKLRH